jgi:hypothetical protein
MNRVLLLLVGVVLGVVALAAVRWTVAPPPLPTHYHANWALFVNGARVDLSGSQYMEEVTACVPAGETILPTQRTHMHEGNHDIVHVHDDGATWGHLMANLGFGLGDDFLMLHSGERYVADGVNSLKYIVDGQIVLPAYNRVIRSTERLLISYGPESVEDVIATQFPQVASTAAEYNTRPDPAGCSGAAEMTLGQKLRYTFLGPQSSAAHAH